MKNKIEKKELEELKQIQNSYLDLVQKLGEISLQKIINDKKEQKLKQYLEDIQQKEKSIKLELVKKYGDNININIETGEF